jgi:hypothetical protein
LPITLYVSIVKNIARRCFWPRISPPIRVWLKLIIVVTFTVAVGLSNINESTKQLFIRIDECSSMYQQIIKYD